MDAMGTALTAAALKKVVFTRSIADVKEDIMYKITAGIEGMSCGMCESHINDTIRKGFKVKKVSSSSPKNKTEIISEEIITEEALHGVIDPTGYTVTSYECEPYEKKGLFGGFFK